MRERDLVVMVVNGSRVRVEETGQEGQSYILKVDGELVRLEVLHELDRDPPVFLARVQNRIVRVEVIPGDLEMVRVQVNERPFDASLDLLEARGGRHEKGPAQAGPLIIIAPMSGRITALKASVGVATEEGQALVVLEAMKMENEIASPKKGVVKEVYVTPGTLVKAGDKLVLVE